MTKVPFMDDLKRFEEHMNLLRSAVKSEDNRLIAVALVRLAYAAITMAVSPVFANDAKAEWTREPRAMGFARWLNGERVDAADLRKP